MHQDRWQRIEDLFHAALELGASERPGFLIKECAGDNALYAEVDSLLFKSEAEDGFLSDPVLTTGLSLLTIAESASLVGQQVGRYNIIAQLGRGGMGEVYLAEDPRLGRRVALKLLPAYLTGDRVSILRFQDEARAASGVSHPNVAHIYEVDDADGQHYLAMEYVEGMTLRQMLRYESLNVNEATEIALQVANALMAAHAAKIIHRDIKPENIMVQASGMVKVLDFGVAKFSENSDPTEKADDVCPSLSTNGVAPRVIMGTIPYMSPEQVTGQQIDVRSDLWSLGVVLYEMLMGCKPFGGKSRDDIAGAILDKDPPSLASQDAIPPELERIVSRGLTKKVSGRYQSANEFAADLKRLRQQLDFGAYQNSAEYNSSVTQANSELKQTPLSFLVGNRFLLGLLLVCVLGLAAFVIFKGNSTRPSTRISQALRITNTGRAVRAAISKDGEMIAYALEQKGAQGLFQRRNQLGSGENPDTSPVVIVPPGERRFSGVAFSPDAKTIFYSAKAPGEEKGALFSITADGPPQMILSDIESAPSFSPDGRKMVFLRVGSDNSHEDLCIANVDGTELRVLYTRVMPQFISHLAQPSWSPDGTLIVCAAGTYTDKGQQSVPALVRVTDGQLLNFPVTPWAEIWQTDWLGDGSAFILTGRRELTHDNKQLWRVNYPGGETIRLTDDFNDYFGVSVTRDAVAGEQITTLVLDRTAQLWLTDLAISDGTAIQQLTSAGNDGFGVSWARDGSIAYGSMASGNPDIWITGIDGSNKRQLTVDPNADTNPLVTTDQRFIVFNSERSGVRSLWRMTVDGQGLLQLVRGSSATSIALSPDSRTVYYYSYFGGLGALWRVGIDGGEPQKLATGSLEFPVVSPDGETIALSYRASAQDKYQIGLVKTSGMDRPPRVVEQVAGANIPGRLRWTNDGKALVYVVTRNGVSNLWLQPVDVGEPRSLTRFISDRIFAFDLSPDGRRAVCARGEVASYAVLLSLKPH